MEPSFTATAQVQNRSELQVTNYYGNFLWFRKSVRFSKQAESMYLGFSDRRAPDNKMSHLHTQKLVSERVQTPDTQEHPASGPK